MTLLVFLVKCKLKLKLKLTEARFTVWVRVPQPPNMAG
jgi:hypothetical protein